MIYKEEHRDLFSVPKDYYLAHCISADFALGAGIAVEFDKRFDMKNKLNEKYPSNDWHGNGYCLLASGVFNLVTKEKYWHKPTYKTLQQSLEYMKNEIRDMGWHIKKIAMPCIGSGLDRLSWVKVSDIIKDVFKDTDAEILVCIK